jgi:hypothetical protein
VVIVDRFSPVSLGTATAFFSAGVFFFSTGAGFLVIVFFCLFCLSQIPSENYLKLNRLKNSRV